MGGLNAQNGGIVAKGCYNSMSILEIYHSGMALVLGDLFLVCIIKRFWGRCPAVYTPGLGEGVMRLQLAVDELMRLLFAVLCEELS